MDWKVFWKIFLLGAFVVLFILTVQPSLLGSAPMAIVMFGAGFILIWLGFVTQDTRLVVVMIILLFLLALLYLWPGIQVTLPLLDWQF